MFLRAYCFVNVLTLSCLGSVWFGIHPFTHMWYISITKDCHCPKYFILCVVYFYSERPSLSKIFYSMWSISIAKDHRFAEKCGPRLWWSKPNKVVDFFVFAFGKTLDSNIMVYRKKVSDYTTFILMTT